MNHQYMPGQAARTVGLIQTPPQYPLGDFAGHPVPQPARVGEVKGQMDLMATGLDLLASEIELLEKQMAPVLSSHISGESSQQTQAPSACEYGETLNRYAHAARRMAAKVAELRARLEV